MTGTENDVIAIQNRQSYLSNKLEECRSRKKRLEDENVELSSGYDKFIKVKNQIIEENNAYVQSLRKKAGTFTAALSCVHSFCDSVQNLINGEQNQGCLSSLDEAISKIKKQIIDNDNSIIFLNEEINSINCELRELRVQLSSLGG